MGEFWEKHPHLEAIPVLSQPLEGRGRGRAAEACKRKRRKPLNPFSLREGRGKVWVPASSFFLCQQGLPALRPEKSPNRECIKGLLGPTGKPAPPALAASMCGRRWALSAAPSGGQCGPAALQGAVGPCPVVGQRSALSLSGAPSKVGAVKLTQAPRCPMDASAASCDCGGSGLGALPAASPSQAWVAGVLSRAAPQGCQSWAAASIPGSPVGAAAVRLSDISRPCFSVFSMEAGPVSIPVRCARLPSPFPEPASPLRQRNGL